jgi:protein-S-isoprenylcysteine O-methyltransferase Ste14
MKNDITVFGSGIKIGAIGLPYLGVTIVLSIIYRPTFNITFIPDEILFIVGLIFVIIGESVNAVSAAKMIKAYNNKELVRGGPYSICANPMYASQVFLAVPGVALMAGSWLVLTTTIVGFIAIKLFVKREEEYLRNQFGVEYDEYRKKVLIKFI